MNLISVPGPNPLEALLNLLILLLSSRKDQQTFHTDFFFLSLGYVTDLVGLSCSVQRKITSTIWPLRTVSSTTFIFLFYHGWSKVSFVQIGAQKTRSVSRSLTDGQLCMIFNPINVFMGIRWGLMLKWSFGFCFRSNGIGFSLLVSQIYMEWIHIMSFFQ